MAVIEYISRDKTKALVNFTMVAGGHRQKRI